MKTFLFASLAVTILGTSTSSQANPCRLDDQVVTATRPSMPRRAEQLLNLDVDRRFGSVGVGASVHAEGRRRDNTQNTNELSGYNTVDLRAQYWFSHAWRGQVSVTNLFDTGYETARSHAQPGRAGYLPSRYQPI